MLSITIEGPAGSGKTAVAQKIYNVLQAAGMETLLVDDGEHVSEAIKNLPAIEAVIIVIQTADGAPGGN